MKPHLFITVLQISILLAFNTAHAVGLEHRTITLKSNERFDLVQAKSVTFKFQSLSEDARKLEITNGASALGVAYLGQVKLKENHTTLSALRSIADQMGESLDISFGVIADSNTSEALKTNELLLLYHPDVTITLALARVDENSDFEIICTYALKELVEDKAEIQNDPQQSAPEKNPEVSNEPTPAEDALEESS
ncbi:MAG: hypothetical protein ACRBDX_06170 [Gammaproteobacteria bacterium]